ncbi:OPT-domain-containing protein [Mycena sanguinolenta]|nr:OPT-domain-containing protein [Mycena sanguinolenta]
MKPAGFDLFSAAFEIVYMAENSIRQEGLFETAMHILRKQLSDPLFSFVYMKTPRFLEKAHSSNCLHVGDIQTGSKDLLEAAAHARTMSAAEVDAVLNRIVNEHGDDPHFPTRVLNDANRYLFDHKLKEEHPAEYQRLYDELKVEAAMIAINSPYSEVRAVVDNHDDPWVLASTFRAWFIGTVLVVGGGLVNLFFSIRYPTIQVGSNVAQILAVPLAKLMELLPSTEFATFGYAWSFNPGPFNPKEHMLTTVGNSSVIYEATTHGIQIMANVGFVTPYTNDVHHMDTISAEILQPGGLSSFRVAWFNGFVIKVILSQFGSQRLELIKLSVLVALSTNLVGYGLAGLTRRFLVYPASAIWLSFCQEIWRYLSSVVSSAQHLRKHSRTDYRPKCKPYRSLRSGISLKYHSGHSMPIKPTVVDGWSVSRLHWFLYCFGAMFVYFWFPDFIRQALSYFNWMTWISPMNVSLAAITGSVFGLGFDPLPTFDWNQITIMTDPLINPFFTTFNLFLGALITFPIIVAIWYTNTWNTGYLPINSHVRADACSEIGSSCDTLFNQTMYENYSPAYLSASNAIIYGGFFALYTATLSHTFLYHRREIIHGFRSILSRDKTSGMHKDVHVRLMESYKEVTEWQYLAVMLFAIVVGAVGVGVYPTNTSQLLFSILAILFVVPVGIIASTTNAVVTLNVISEMYIYSNYGDVMLTVYSQSYGLMTTYQTINFASDLKLAHYMHIPPQLTFSAQIYATVISTFVCTGILNFQMTKIPGVCTPDQPNHFTCPDVNALFTASVLWGVLGPKRMFGPGGLYNALAWKVKALEYLHIPVLLSGGLVWAPYSLANIWPAVPIGYFCNVFIKTHYVAWWSKYNYVTTTAFSTAIAICGIVIFFGVEWPGVNINCSGNNRPFEGCDAMGCARVPLPAQGFFGPDVGDFR